MRYKMAPVLGLFRKVEVRMESSPFVQLVRCVQRRLTRKGVTREETSYAITSLSPKKANAQRSLQVWP